MDSVGIAFVAVAMIGFANSPEHRNSGKMGCQTVTHNYYI
jgi:hypothetical protein